VGLKNGPFFTFAFYGEKYKVRNGMKRGWFWGMLKGKTRPNWGKVALLNCFPLKFSKN